MPQSKTFPFIIRWILFMLTVQPLNWPSFLLFSGLNKFSLISLFPSSLNIPDKSTTQIPISIFSIILILVRKIYVSNSSTNLAVRPYHLWHNPQNTIIYYKSTTTPNRTYITLVYTDILLCIWYRIHKLYIFWHISWYMMN